MENLALQGFLAASAKFDAPFTALARQNLCRAYKLVTTFHPRRVASSNTVVQKLGPHFSETYEF